jgi:hypothetical protein
VKTQQIPKPLAQGPAALPLLSVHSEKKNHDAQLLIITQLKIGFKCFLVNRYLKTSSGTHQT